jgi:hypothetical protein
MSNYIEAVGKISSTLRTCKFSPVHRMSDNVERKSVLNFIESLANFILSKESCTFTSERTKNFHRRKREKRLTGNSSCFSLPLHNPYFFLSASLLSLTIQKRRSRKQSKRQIIRVVLLLINLLTRPHSAQNTPELAFCALTC